MSDIKSVLAVASGVAGLSLATIMTVNDISTNFNLLETDKPKKPLTEEVESKLDKTGENCIQPLPNTNNDIDGICNEHGLQLPSHD